MSNRQHGTDNSGEGGNGMAHYVIPTCAICLDPLLRDLATLPCGHVFHFQCINCALRNAPSNKPCCPFCRAPYQRRTITKLHTMEIQCSDPALPENSERDDESPEMSYLKRRERELSAELAKKIEVISEKEKELSNLHADVQRITRERKKHEVDQKRSEQTVKQLQRQIDAVSRENDNLRVSQVVSEFLEKGKMREMLEKLTELSGIRQNRRRGRNARRRDGSDNASDSDENDLPAILSLLQDCGVDHVAVQASYMRLNSLQDELTREKECVQSLKAEKEALNSQCAANTEENRQLLKDCQQALDLCEIWKSKYSTVKEKMTGVVKQTQDERASLLQQLSALQKQLDEERRRAGTLLTAAANTPRIQSMFSQPTGKAPSLQPKGNACPSRSSMVPLEPDSELIIEGVDRNTDMLDTVQHTPSRKTTASDELNTREKRCVDPLPVSPRASTTQQHESITSPTRKRNSVGTVLSSDSEGEDSESNKTLSILSGSSTHKASNVENRISGRGMRNDSSGMASQLPRPELHGSIIRKIVTSSASITKDRIDPVSPSVVSKTAGVIRSITGAPNAPAAPKPPMVTAVPSSFTVASRSPLYTQKPTKPAIRETPKSHSNMSTATAADVTPPSIPSSLPSTATDTATTWRTPSPGQALSPLSTYSPATTMPVDAWGNKPGSKVLRRTPMTGTLDDFLAPPLPAPSSARMSFSQSTNSMQSAPISVSSTLHQSHDASGLTDAVGHKRRLLLPEKDTNADGDRIPRRVILGGGDVQSLLKRPMGPLTMYRLERSASTPRAPSSRYVEDSTSCNMNLNSSSSSSVDRSLNTDSISISEIDLDDTASNQLHTSPPRISAPSSITKGLLPPSNFPLNKTTGRYNGTSRSVSQPRTLSGQSSSSYPSMRSGSLARWQQSRENDRSVGGHLGHPSRNEIPASFFDLSQNTDGIIEID